MTTPITRLLVPESERINHTNKLFGIHFPMRLEPFVYGITSNLSVDYTGGYWEFYELSNGGFYMAPTADSMFKVSCENGYEGQLSADALGIVACMYAYSNLSFGEDRFAQTCAEHYHWLREYMLEHGEVGRILKAID